MSIVAGPALLLATYAVGSFLSAPYLVDAAVKRYIAASTGRSARVERVRFNPFTLNIELASVELRADGEDLSFTAAQVDANLSIGTLLQRRPIFDLVSIEQPRLRVAQTGLRLLSSELATRARIDRLLVSNGEFELADRAGTDRRELSLSRIDVTATRLDGRTAAASEPDAGGRYTLHAVGPAGAELDLEGTLTAGFMRASGRIAVSGLDLEAIRPWLGARLGALRPSGSFALTGDYSLTAPLTAPALEIANAHTEVRDLGLEPASGFVVSAPQLSGTANARLAVSEAAARPYASLDVAGADFDLRDARMSALSVFAFAGVTGALTADTDAMQWAIDLEGRLADAGRASLTARLPAAPGAERTYTLELTDVPAAMLSPYASRSLGRGLDAGRLDVALDYTQRGERLSGDAHIVARGLALNSIDTGALPPRDESPLELAAALLENERGIIDIDMPFAASSRSVGTALAGAIAAQIAALNTAPFAELGALVGTDAGALRAVRFEPGAAGLAAPALETIDNLAVALRERPRLGLRISGAFDATADRNALAKQQIELHVLLATAGPSPQARPEPVDFAAPRAQDVLDEFAGERLTPARLAAIAARYECGGTSGAPCGEAYYAEVFDALVANESISSAALTRLGRFRAQSIAGALTERGIAAERIEIGNGTPVTLPQAVGVPLEIRAKQPNAP